MALYTTSRFPKNDRGSSQSFEAGRLSQLSKPFQNYQMIHEGFPVGELSCLRVCLLGLLRLMSEPRMKPFDWHADAIERGDFGSGTSQNSLKIIHGGLRRLQDGNLSRIRMMTRECTTWMKIAPHLVHPLTCLIPTTQQISRSRAVMGLALRANDLLSFDRNHLVDPEKNLLDVQQTLQRLQ